MQNAHDGLAREVFSTKGVEVDYKTEQCSLLLLEMVWGKSKDVEVNS